MAFKMKGNPLKMGSMATKSTMKMGHKSPAKMKKESAMELSEEDKKKAMDNAMPSAEVKSMSKESMAGAKKYGFMDGGSFNKDKARLEIKKRQNILGGSEKNIAKRDGEIAEIRKLMKAFS